MLNFRNPIPFQTETLPTGSGRLGGLDDQGAPQRKTPRTTQALLLLLGLILAVAFPAHGAEGKIRVVTTLQDLRSIAEFVGGEKVTVSALAEGYQDPHYVVPKPSLMQQVRDADLFVELGLDLELWTERVLDGARNPDVRVGNPGHVYAAQGVRVLQKPETITRAEGDLHPQGNPHVWLDPLNGKILAGNIVEGLKRIAPEHAAYFEQQLETFERETDERLFGAELVKLLGGDILTRLARQGNLIEFLEEKELGGTRLINRLDGWLGRSLRFRDQKILTFHQAWIYFATRFGLEVANTVEEKPGIPPSAKRRKALIRQVQRENIPLIVVGTYYDDSVPRAIAASTGAEAVILPIMTGGAEGIDDYFELFDHLIETLSERLPGD